MGITSIRCFFNYSVLRKVEQLEGLVAGGGSLATLGTGGGPASFGVMPRTFQGDAEDLLG